MGNPWAVRVLELFTEADATAILDIRPAANVITLPLRFDSGA
jgi:hypothetical protein